MLKIEIIRSPTESFLEMLLNNVRPPDRKKLEGVRWGAVGLIQSLLIDLYRASDIAEKSSDVRTTLVLGNCPQHIQMLAVLAHSRRFMPPYGRSKTASLTSAHP